MSTRNGSYARVVDGMGSNKSQANDNTASKATPSPSSARPAFDCDKTQKMKRKVHRNANAHSPSPDRAPQPRGMGESGVNRSAHYAKMQRANENGRKRPTSHQTQAMTQKAGKAAKGINQHHREASQTKGLGR